MQINSFTYRLFTALVLMLFMSTVVVPSGISAASLLCDMEMAELHTGSTDCCDVDDLSMSDHHRKMAADENCHSEKICLHALAPDQTQPEAVVSSNVKNLLDLPVINKGISPSENRNKADLAILFSAVPNDFPPIFLLNSTFLN